MFKGVEPGSTASARSWAILSAGLAVLTSGWAVAANPLPAETHLVGLANAPTATEETFSIDTAQDLTVTLTDFQQPAALGSATVIVTQAGAVVGNATLTPPATSATVGLTGAVGSFTLRVVGTPNASFSVGTFSVCVAPKANPSNCIQSASIAGNIASRSTAADPTVSTLDSKLTVTVAGAYTVTFADDAFPQALAVAPNLALFQGSAAVALAIKSGDVVNLSAGTYTLLSLAQADQTVRAGLYGLKIAGPAGTAPLIDATIPVGVLGAATAYTNPNDQSLDLSVVDFAFPTPVTAASAVVTAGSRVLGQASTLAGSNFTATAGDLKIWNWATVGSDAGTYEVDLKGGGATLLQTAASVNQGTSLAFALPVAALDAGTYQANVSDFQFPAALQTVQFAVAQSGAVLQKSTTAGSVNFTAAAGPAVVLVNATVPAKGNGVFDAYIQTTGSAPHLVFDKTQAVSTSGAFDTRSITVGGSGNYDVTLTDLKQPAQFQNLGLLVSSGGSVLGKIFGGGTTSISATAGQYQLTFVATPATSQMYGLYAVQVTSSQPTITLSASPTSLASGDSTKLTWTTSNATACTGSGGTFTGSQATGSGSATVVVSATTTYTLTCTGDGGSFSNSVTVTATAAPAKPSGGGGGGSMNYALLVLLALVAAVRGHAAVRLVRSPPAGL